MGLADNFHGSTFLPKQKFKTNHICKLQIRLRAFTRMKAQIAAHKRATKPMSTMHAFSVL